MDRSCYERRLESRHVRHRSAVLLGVRNDRKAGCYQCSPGVEQARDCKMQASGVLIGVGSRRRSASQAIDLPGDGGVNLGRLFTDHEMPLDERPLCAKTGPPSNVV